jgi:outer membrane protein assembly factor BamD (BamD/ComL family)
LNNPLPPQAMKTTAMNSQPRALKIQIKAFCGKFKGKYNHWMNENLETTQPTKIENTQPSQVEATQPTEPQKDDTQPIKPIKKPSRWRSFFIGLLGFLVLVGLGGYGGFKMGIGDRTVAETSILSKQLMEQYQFALVDIQFGRYETAQQRLEFIVAKDPNYPGVAEKLTEVMVLSTIPTATITPTVTSTPDFSGVENAYQRAQQLTNAQDWQNAMGALDMVRKLDPTYKAAQVDGMYYFALRNFGHDLILKQGNLEGGIYQLTLAERFGPLDSTSVQLREGARLYIIGASFWEIDWRQAITYFSQVSSNIWDGDMTAAERLDIAHARYGDQLFEGQEFCAAYEQYSLATTLDPKSADRAAKSSYICFPPTPVAPIITDVPIVPTP